MTQTSLDLDPNPFQPGSQNDRLLRELRRGPVTNSDMIRDLKIFKYTSRVSDLRARGFDVRCTEMDNGLCVYRLN